MVQTMKVHMASTIDKSWGKKATILHHLADLNWSCDKTLCKKWVRISDFDFLIMFQKLLMLAEAFQQTLTDEMFMFQNI